MSASYFMNVVPFIFLYPYNITVRILKTFNIFSAYNISPRRHLLELSVGIMGEKN